MAGRRGVRYAVYLPASGMWATKLFAVVIAAGAIVGLSSCATYRTLPLPVVPDLAVSLSQLNTAIPEQTAGSVIRKIDTTRPLTIDQIGLLAILNDPDLKSERGEIDVAHAGVVQAILLPNPVANVSYGALVSGPGTTSSISAALSQDVVAIITQGARYRSAESQFFQVDADQLWREWQVAQKARQLAADIYSGDLAINLTKRELTLLSQELAQVRKAIADENLTLTALAPLSAAQAVAEQSLITIQLNQLKNWQSLDGLLGLDPKVRFSIARPVFEPLPSDVKSLLENLAERRPDLAALRFGYDSTEENVRAAILGQFPALTLGGNYNKDTTDVVSAGPTFNFALPVFDRNQGQISKAAATRLLLLAQYQARLDSAVASVRSLIAQIDQLSADLLTARSAASTARSLAATARRAYVQNNLDQRTFTDYETTALERALQVISIERQISEDKIFFAVELGLGLPKIRIALSGNPPL